MIVVNGLQSTQAYETPPMADWSDERDQYAQARSMPDGGAAGMSDSASDEQLANIAAQARDAAVVAHAQGSAAASAASARAAASASAAAIANASAQPAQLQNAAREAAATRLAEISAAWQAHHQSGPYRLMQMMVEFGWTVADLAQATGQSEQAVGDYLTANGAPAGFGGAATLGREYVDQPYLQALDAALQAMPREAQVKSEDPMSPYYMGTTTMPAAQPWWTLTRTTNSDGVDHYFGTFDLNGFNRWYVAQSTPESETFFRFHGEDFLRNPVGVQQGSCELRLDGEQYVINWHPSSITWGNAQAQAAIRSYLTYPVASAAERGLMELTLADPLNQEIVRTYGRPTTLPDGEQSERMRARYGTDLATRLLQFSQATAGVRAAYVQALDVAMHQGGHLGNMLPNGSPYLYSPDSSREVDAQYPWWTVLTIHYSGDNGDSVSSVFDPNAFHTWYLSQDTPQARLFAHLYGTDFQKHDAYLNSEDPYPTFRYFVGDNNRFEITLGRFVPNGSDDYGPDWVPGGMTASQESGLVALNLGSPPELWDNSGVFFDPVLGFVTTVENLKPKDPDFIDMIVPVIVVAIVAYFSAFTLGPAAASAMGLTGNAAVIASAAVAGAATSAASGMVNGNLTFKGVLKGALSGVLTAGLLQGLEAVGGAAAVATGTATGIAARATLQGAVQAMLGGSFKDGALAGLASGLAAAASLQINAGIDTALCNGSMTLVEAEAARFCARMIGSAIRVVGSGSDNPGYEFASAFLNDVLVTANPESIPAPPSTPAVEPNNDELIVEVAQPDPLSINPEQTVGTPPSDSEELHDELVETGPPAQPPGQSPNASPPVMIQDGVTYEGEWQLQPDGRLVAIWPPVVISRSRTEALLQLEAQEAELLRWGITPLPEPDAFMGPLSQTQEELLTDTGYLLDAADAARVVQLREEGELLTLAGSAPALLGLPLRYGSLAALAGELATAANGALGTAGRVLVTSGETLAALGALVLEAPITAVTLLVMPSNVGQSQPVYLNDDQRFVAAPGDLYGNLEERNANGDWLVSKSDVVLVDLGSQRIVALTDEERRQLSGPLTTPGTPLPPPPSPVNVPPSEQQPIAMPGPAPVPLHGHEIEIYPADPPPTLEDMITTRDYGNIPEEHHWRYDRYLEGDRSFYLGPREWYARAQTAWENNLSGNSFEQEVRTRLETPMGAGSKPVSIEGYVPDLPVGSEYGVTDVKNLIELNNSDQLRAFHRHAVENGLPFNLIIGPRTETISAPLLDNIRQTGGAVIQYDPATAEFTTIEIGQSGPWRRGTP